MLGNAAGCHSTTIEELEELDYTFGCDRITTKTMTLHPHGKIADIPKRVCVTNDYSWNCVGLVNLGFDAYYKFATDPSRITPVVLSLSTHNLSETVQMLDKAGNLPVELNFSCPNRESDFEYMDFEQLRKVQEVWHFEYPFGIKLPPLLYKSQFDAVISEICEASPMLQFLTCCNTIPLYNIVGGYGGSSITRRISQNVVRCLKIEIPSSIQLVGCGGISSKRDIEYYLTDGASSVQIGTELLRRGVGVFKEVNE